VQFRKFFRDQSTTDDSNYTFWTLGVESCMLGHYNFFEKIQAESFFPAYYI